MSAGVLLIKSLHDGEAPKIAPLCNGLNFIRETNHLPAPRPFCARRVLPQALALHCVHGSQQGRLLVNAWASSGASSGE